MHRRPLIGVLAVFVFGTGISGVGAQQETPPTVIDALEASGNHTQFLAAIEAASMTDVLRDPNAAFTVFAPGDAAFAAATFPADLAEELAPSHIVPGVFTVNELLRLTTPVRFATTGGTTVTLLSNFEVIVNERVRVTTPDLMAGNGVIHVIDSVILPTDDDASGAATVDAVSTAEATGELLGSIAPIGMATIEVMQPRLLPAYDLLSSNIGFSTLVAAVDAAEPQIQNVLRGGRYTVFAPQDANFTLALQSLGLTAESLLADSERLNRILAYHVVPWRYTYDELAALDGALVGTLLPGTALIVRVSNGVVTINNAPVSQSTFNPAGSALHPLSGVLIPPEAVTIAG